MRFIRKGGRIIPIKEKTDARSDRVGKILGTASAGAYAVAGHELVKTFHGMSAYVGSSNMNALKFAINRANNAETAALVGAGLGVVSSLAYASKYKKQIKSPDKKITMAIQEHSKNTYGKGEAAKALTGLVGGAVAGQYGGKVLSIAASGARKLSEEIRFRRAKQAMRPVAGLLKARF